MQVLVGGEAEERARDEEEKFFSQSVRSCDVFGKEKDVCVGWSSRTLDLKFDSLGQAQNLILTPHKLLVSTLDPFNIQRSLLKVICEKKKKLVGFDWAQKKVDFTFNPMGQTHNFIITPPIFANNRRVLLVEEEMDQKKFIGSDWAQSQYLSMNFTTNASVFEFVGAPKIEMENMKILFPTNIEYRGTNIHERGEVKEVGVNTPIIVEYPVVHEWDPGGIQQDESIMESATTCHRNQTPHNQQGAPFNNEERCLKIASDRENKKLHPSIHEFRIWNQCIGADICVAKGGQGLHVGIILGMYANSLHIENVLLHHHLVAKISSYNSPLLPNTMKAWHEKSTKGFKHSSSNKSVELEDEYNIQGVGAMLWELIIGRTPKKANDVEAFKSLLQASRGVDKEAWRSNVDLEICKAYLAQSLKALIEICVEHLIQGSESLRVAMVETHHKQWDPGEPYSVSCIIETSCFKLWDPGGRPLSLEFFPYLHLEDKVNFKGGSIDENLALPNKFGKVYSRRGKIGINYRIRYLGGKSCNNLAESARWECAEVHAYGVS